MSRPKKQTVDYFPHLCNHGQTIFILEQKYQTIGYSFWFKLLEELGKRDGHIIDCRNIGTLRFLQAKTFTDEETCIEILDLLAELEAIDSELWQEKIIWCQKFVDGIADVYNNRRVETPVKPNFYRQKPHDAVVSTDGNPQSKVKESKVNSIVANATPSIIINKAIYPMEELTYEPLDGKKKKNPYGNKVMAVLTRKFAESAGVEIGESFDASAWSKPLSAIYRYFNNDPKAALDFIERACKYFKDKDLTFTPHTLHKNLPLIDKWIDDEDKKHFNPELYE